MCNFDGSSGEDTGAVRAIAYFEAIKGVLALLVASGVLALVRVDRPALFMTVLAHLHLKVVPPYAHIFNLLAQTPNTRLCLFATGGAVYALIRFVEAYGLYFGYAWAEVLAAFSSGMYIPLEWAGFIRHPGWFGLALLLLNLTIFWIMLRALQSRRGARRELD